MTKKKKEAVTLEKKQTVVAKRTVSQIVPLAEAKEALRDYLRLRGIHVPDNFGIEARSLDRFSSWGLREPEDRYLTITWEEPLKVIE